MQCRRNYTLTALVIVLPLLGALKADANGDACIVAVEMECAKDFHAKWCQRVDFQFQCPHVKQEITWGGSIKWYLAEPAGGPPRSHVGILGPWVSGLHHEKKCHWVPFPDPEASGYGSLSNGSCMADHTESFDSGPPELNLHGTCGELH